MAKVTVSFVTREDDSSFKIESDSERNRDCTGSLKTKFRYGDTAYFRVYSHEPDRVQVCATDGIISDMGIYTDSITDEIIPFVTEATVSTDKPVKSLSGYSWLGKSLGTVSPADSYSVKSSDAPSPENGSIAIASINYQSAYRLYGLTLSKRDMDEYPVIVYVGAQNA